jgi:hypothetical protein
MDMKKQWKEMAEKAGKQAEKTHHPARIAAKRQQL